MTKSKYPKYQDYVIKDGELVGEFEQMYKEYADPWHQSSEKWASDKALAIHLTTTLRVTELWNSDAASVISRAASRPPPSLSSAWTFPLPP